MLVLNIQRMSTEDGPGIRTTVFVKGCPLACKWCHNPESIAEKKQIEWIKARCIGCMACMKNCPNGALASTQDGIVIDRNKCRLCMKCVEACPTLAMECKGEDWTVDKLFNELMKDKAYFGAEGGVTVSGGEVLSQAAEAAELFKRLKQAGIHTAADTSGMCTREAIDAVWPFTDMFLYDIKHIDSALHKSYTGKSNNVILENFEYIAAKAVGTNKKIWIRTPIIPGTTDTEDNIRGIAEFLKNRYDRWELCAFNNLCRDKYERLYRLWEYKDSLLMTKERMQELTETAKAAGAINVAWTGMTRL